MIFWEHTAAWIEFFAVLYLFNFEIVLLVMVTRVGPLELVIIGLEKASLVTHNGSFPPILFFVQSFSSLWCIIFSPHFTIQNVWKGSFKIVYFFFKYISSQSLKQYHPEENISDLSFCFGSMLWPVQYSWPGQEFICGSLPEQKHCNCSTMWDGLLYRILVLLKSIAYIAHCMEVSKVHKNQGRQ